jgi:hypothetical protein
MWDSSLHLYKKYKTFIKKYNILFCLHYSLWIIPTSGIGLGRAQSLNFWHGLGPSSTCLFVHKGMGYPFCGPISYVDVALSSDKATIAVITRDHSGIIIKAWAKENDILDPTVAEANAIRWALELLVNQTFRRNIFILNY